MNEFKIPVESKSVQARHIISMHLMAGFMYMLLGAITWVIPDAFKENQNNFLNNIGLIYVGLGLLFLIITIVLSKKINTNKSFNTALRILEIALFLPILIYSLYKSWYLPAIYGGLGIASTLFAWYLESNKEQPNYVFLSENGVQLSRFMRNSFVPWHEVNRLIIRHGNITIDCRNNKLFQYTIHNYKDVINKEDIELFALKMIEKHKDKYDANW